ncbi:radical SAM protein [Halobacteriovorax sp. HLS]|uniref:radical SAM protein n=1 Tax=Halobacteriovorax sp. HLS TaxID=2234000 RepID=UPI000FDABE0F|nr:radical SAM protein [Halobacteriovorax sp. HLS]
MSFQKKLIDRFEGTKDVLDLFEREKRSKNNFCIVPFTTIILEPNGSVGICRLKGTEYSIGNLKNNTLAEIWNGEIVRKWRREFIEGNSTICRKEIDFRNCNLCQENNKLYEYATIEEIQKTPILKLTANFNGFCNLECQMCHVWKMPNGFYTEENFWQPAREMIFPSLKEVDMLSGEPFLQSDTYKLFDEVTKFNPDCLWTFNSNFHWKLNDRIKSYLDKIVVKNLIVSIDSLDKENYARIRKKGNLDVVLDNLDRVIEYEKDRISRGKSSLGLNLNFLVMKENWKEVENVFSFCKEKDIFPFITFCYEPEEYSLLTLDDDNKKEVLNYYLSLNEVQIFMLSRVIKPVLMSLENKIDQANFLLEYKEKCPKFFKA